VSGTLLVAHEYVMNLAVLEGVVGREDGSARISKDVRDVFALKAFPENLCTGLGHVDT
jgi:hypothetical protein